MFHRIDSSHRISVKDERRGVGRNTPYSCFFQPKHNKAVLDPEERMWYPVLTEPVLNHPEKEYFMEINLKDTLRRLRKEKNLTQEDVAEYLGITAQSVGKWERGEGFPDITLLPSLALYFGVTVDDLLGVGAERQEERIREILDEAERLFVLRRIDEYNKLLREALRTFPNEHRIMRRLMTGIHWSDCGEHKEDGYFAVELGERILAESTNHRLRTSTICQLASICYDLGEKEKGRAYAEMLGSYYQTRENTLFVRLGGEEGVLFRQSSIRELTTLLTSAILYRHCTGGEVPDDDLYSAKKALALLDLIYEDGDYLLAMEDVYEAHFKAAEAYGKKRDAEACLNALTLAAEDALRIKRELNDCLLTEEKKHTSRLINRITVHPGETNCYRAVELMRTDMEEYGVFDFLRNDSRFLAILERLKEAE